MAIQDTDIFVVQRGEQAFKMPATQLNDYVEVDGGLANPDDLTSYKDITLQYVCAQGSSPATCNRSMQVNGDLTVSNTVFPKGVQCGDGGIGITGGGLSATGNIGCNGTLSSSVLGITGTGSVGGLLSALGGIQAGNNVSAVGEFTFNSVHAYNAIGGGSRRDATINSGGWLTAGDDTFLRSTATNIQPIDTSNFISALKAVNLHASDQPVPETSRQFQVDPNLTTQNEVGLFIDDIQTTTASNFLLSNDQQGSFITNRRYAHFLFGVCKEQQALIENLTTRIEQLEADHTAAMGNMQNNGGY